MITTQELTLLRIICAAVGAILLFLEVYKSQQIEKIKNKLDFLEQNGVVKKLALYKNDFREYIIQSNMETFKITRENAEYMYNNMDKDEFDKLSAPTRALSEKNLKTVLMMYAKKTNPKVLSHRKLLLFTGIFLILFSAVIDIFENV